MEPLQSLHMTIDTIINTDLNLLDVSFQSIFHLDIIIMYKYKCSVHLRFNVVLLSTDHDFG